jgi:translation initiation factor 4E
MKQHLIIFYYKKLLFKDSNGFIDRYHMHNLNNEWILWFHDPINNDWSFESYINIHTINTIEAFWEVFNNINKLNIENGMFFLMKKGIKPMWEDEQNKKGGCWSFKVLKDNVYETWLDLFIHCINESMLTDISHIDKINGLSISPKKTFCIIKIWVNKSINKDIINNNIININTKECIYKKHIS